MYRKGQIGRKSVKIMSISEITTLGIQSQLPDRRIASEEVSIPLEAGSSLQMSEGDVVTLNFADKQSFSDSYSEAQFEGGQTVQEISSVARAASTYSQVVEGDLNKDELIAIQKLAANIKPIAEEFLSSDPEGLDIEKAIAVLTDNQEVTEEIAMELENTVIETLGLGSSSQANLDNSVVLGVISAEVETSGVNVDNIRQLPELASATVDAELQKQFQVLNESSKELIIDSLNDLMRFFHEKVSQVLEPLKHPVSLATGVEAQVSDEAGLVEIKTLA